MKEQLTQELVLGKLDVFGNLQTLSRIPSIKVSLETLNGDNFLVGSLFNATDIKISPDKKHLILGKVCQRADHEDSVRLILDRMFIKLL